MISGVAYRASVSKGRGDRLQEGPGFVEPKIASAAPFLIIFSDSSLLQEPRFPFRTLRREGGPLWKVLKCFKTATDKILFGVYSHTGPPGLNSQRLRQAG